MVFISASYEMNEWASERTTLQPCHFTDEKRERREQVLRVVSLWTETPEASFFSWAPVQGSFPALPPLIRARSLVIGSTVVGNCFSETGWLSQFSGASVCDVTQSSVGGIPRRGFSLRGRAGVGVPLGQPQEGSELGGEGDNRLWLRLYMLGEFRADQWPTPAFLGFPCDLAGKESACNAGDLGLIPGLGRSTGEGNSYPIQYSSLENYMDWTVHRVTKSRTRLSDFHFT